MNVTDRFFRGTRARVVRCLRSGHSTVAELAAILEVTDNAVRAHLTSLVADGFVVQVGLKKGIRKPHQGYKLSAAGESLFALAYQPVLRELASVLSERVPEEQKHALFSEAGSRLGREFSSPMAEDFEARLSECVNALASLGAVAEVDRSPSRVVLRGVSCPIRSAVQKCPSACTILESLLAEIVGQPVTQRCNHEGAPSCRFEFPLPPSRSREAIANR